MDKKEQVRQTLAKLIEEKELNYRRVSLMLGKGDSYIQRFIKLGQPERLPEYIRLQLAKILHVDEQLLTDLPIERRQLSLNINSVTIDIISATPCCGSGSDGDQPDEVIGKWIMPEKDFRELTFSQPNNIKQMRVVGDSMSPTIKDGDYILADTSFNYFEIDGIYLIRMLNGLAVKRLQSGLNDVKILSDNKKYEPITASAGEINIVGKVIKIMNIENV